MDELNQLMRSYNDSYEQDPDLQSSDTNLRTNLESILSSLADGGAGGISMDYLKKVISFICKWNQKTAERILDCNDELWDWMTENKECLYLVEEYFKNSSEVLEFCSELKKFLITARTSHSDIQYMIQQIERDIDVGLEEDLDDEIDPFGMFFWWHKPSRYLRVWWKLIMNTSDKDLFSNATARRRYGEICQSLKNLRSMDSVFGPHSAVSLREKLKWLGEKQQQMLEKLKIQDERIDKKLKKTRAWNKVTNMIFMSTLVSLVCLGFMTVAAVAVQPHLAAAAAGIAHTHVAATTAAVAHAHVAASTGVLAHAHMAASTAALAHAHLGASTAALAHAHIGVGGALAHGHIGAGGLAHAHIGGSTGGLANAASTGGSAHHIGASMASRLAHTQLGATVAANPHAILATGVIVNSGIAPTVGGQHWVDSLFKKLEKAFEDQKGVINSMQEGNTLVASKELEDIKYLIDELVNYIDAKLSTGDFAVEMGEINNLRSRIKEIKDNLGIFLEKIQDLEETTKNCTAQIREARDKVQSKSRESMRKK